MNKNNDNFEVIAKYLKRGVWQDFQKYHFLKIIFYFCLIDILMSQVASIFFDNVKIHFTKEVARWCMNIIFSIISYLIGRKQERQEIQEKIIDTTKED